MDQTEGLDENGFVDFCWKIVPSYKIIIENWFLKMGIKILVSEFMFPDFVVCEGWFGWKKYMVE